MSASLRPAQTSRPTRGRAVWGGLAFVLMFAMARADGPMTFLGRLFDHDVQLITVTDKTPKGRLLREPGKAHPVYYEACWGIRISAGASRGKTCRQSGKC